MKLDRKVKLARTIDARDQLSNFCGRKNRSAFILAGLWQTRSNLLPTAKSDEVSVLLAMIDKLTHRAVVETRQKGGDKFWRDFAYFLHNPQGQERKARQWLIVVHCYPVSLNDGPIQRNYFTHGELLKMAKEKRIPMGDYQTKGQEENSCNG